MRNIRIEMNGNETRLVYQRGLILEYSPIILTVKHLNHYYTGISYAYRKLKENIRCAKYDLKTGDPLAEKNSKHVLYLLKEKRKVKARESFEPKKPVNRSKHVGVEIEFISKDNQAAIAETLAMFNLTSYVELKSDGSVSGDNDGDCYGSCREDCNCYECDDNHYCDDEDQCTRRTRNYGVVAGRRRGWDYNTSDCGCDETETIDDCNCCGIDAENNPVCNGEHIVCHGHCPGHYCRGYDDHSDDRECECECTCSSEKGLEIAIVAKSKHIAEIVTKVCQALAEHDAYVNKTCGLHVHLDMRGEDVNRAFSSLVKSQNLLYGMVPMSRYNNTYCKPNKSRDMSTYGSRYYGINPQSYSEHKTLEIRLHSGSINAEKINNWIKLLQKIAYSKRRIPIKVKKATDITNALNLADDLKTYISERINKFNNALIFNDLVVNNPEQLDLIAA